MASRRKTTTPCMVPPREAQDSDQEMEDAAEPEDGNGVAEPPEEAGQDADRRAGPDPYLDSNMAEGGYECKYCSFQTAELNLFTAHVDAEHPDVVTNTSYVCMECDYHTKRLTSSSRSSATRRRVIGGARCGDSELLFGICRRGGALLGSASPLPRARSVTMTPGTRR